MPSRVAEPFRPPEPSLTPDEMLARATALQPWLREEQAATEKRTRYSQETHEKLKAAGFYRCLQPRGFGGYEFTPRDFFRVVMELSRGCPSTGWCYCLAASHAVEMAAFFSESVQAKAFGPDGDFVAASVTVPFGTAKRVDGGWKIEGTWRYCSGCPYSTWFIPLVVCSSPDLPEPRRGLAAIPAAEYKILDDWGAILGLRGSGSNSIKVDTVVPEDQVVLVDRYDLDLSNSTPGYRLHGNPQYAGRSLLQFHAQIASVMVGLGWAAIDEYEQNSRTRKTVYPPIVNRMHSPDTQRCLGLAMGLVQAAEDLILAGADRYVALCRRGAEGGPMYSFKEDLHGMTVIEHAGRLVWEGVEALFRSGGTAAAMDDQRMQRYFRDLSVYRTHTGSQFETIAATLGRVQLGLQTGYVPNM